MRGSIQKQGKKSWGIALSLGTDPITGKRKQKWVTIKGTRRAAEKRRTELLHQLNTGTFIEPGKTTLAEFLEQWLTNYARPNVGPRTFEEYTHIIRHSLIPTLGHIPLIQLKPDRLQAFYNQKLGGDKPLSAQSVRHIHTLLHKALQTAIEWEKLSRNPADGVRPPKVVRPEIHTWEAEDVNRFLEVAKETPYYALFYTALFTGMRRSELLALRWEDIDFIFSRLSVRRALHQLKDGSFIFTEPKSAKGHRVIDLSPSTILMLKAHYESQKLEWAMLGRPLTDNDLVFCQIDGSPIRPKTVTRAWPVLARKAGVKVIRFHDARHTHASLMLKQGIHPKIVQERLGHASIQITLDTYSHVAPGLQEAAARKFDEALVIPYNEPVHQVIR
jgi:integrase